MFRKSDSISTRISRIVAHYYAFVMNGAKAGSYKYWAWQRELQWLAEDLGL